MRKSKEFFARALAVALAAAMPLTMGSTSALAANQSAVVSTYDATQASQVDLSTGYTFVYAGLNWNEYWASEGVYASGDATSSDEKDSHSELDKGAFDTVTRATANHGLHRGSYQCIATVYDDNGDKYELAGWTSDGKNMILTDGSQVAFSRGTITKTDGTTVAMDYYEVSGIKYVPVAVKNEDYEAFCKAYKVAKNDSTILGGYGENQLKAYSETAKVTASTNGLKVATKNSDGSFTFSARQTGTDSGIEGQAQKKATDITVTVKDASGSYGEFLRVDINGNGYGDLGANMQTVRWDYYGSDSTRSKVLASYGTKFAADNWMHKSMGIQLGLTDSLRCKLPTGTDGTGYWTLTVYALGYEDTVINFEATDKNIVKPADEDVDTTALEATIKEAEALKEADYSTDSWNAMQLELQEAKDEIAKDKKTQASIDEANTHLTAAIKALEKSVYVLMNIPYDEFYKADLTNDVKVDAFTSATKNKSRTKTMVNGSYHVNADGSDITGVTYAVKLGKGVTLESLAAKYKQVKDDDKVEISVTNRGQSSTTTYEGKDALFENESYAYYVLNEAPTSYKEATLDEDGNIVFGKVQNADAQKITDIEATLLTQSSYGDYQLDLEGLDKYVGRNDAIYGVVVSTKEGDSYGLRHMENIWFGNELSWATGFTTSVHGCPTSSEHYKKMMGQTITKLTYYTEKGNFEIDLGDGIYVPVKFDATSVKVEDAKVDAGSTSIDVAALPSDYQATYSVAGLSDVKVENGKLTFATKDVKPGSYTLTISDASKKYADVKVKFTLSTDANVVAFNNNAKAPALVAVGSASLADYVGNITSVNVDGKDYAASGRGSTVIIKEDGTLDLTNEKVDLTSVGTHTVTVKATGYKDVTFSYQVKTDLSALKATVKDVTYTGKAQTPVVTIEGLTLNKDYKVTYKNNVNAGKATATITGIGSYEGTKTVTFTIKKAASSVSLKAKTATYTGKNIAAAKATVKGSKGKVTYTYYSDSKCTKKATAKNAGTYYVKASVAADSNYNGATSKAVKLTIKKATATIKAKTTSKTVKVSAVKKKAQSFTIGATATSKAKVTYKKSSGSKNITVSSTGKVTVKKGTKKGTYSVKVKTFAKATSNYNAVSKTVTMKVVVK